MNFNNNLTFLMINKIKFFLSNFGFIYSFVKKLRFYFSNNKVFYLISADHFILEESKKFIFNEKNLNDLLVNTSENSFIFITNKKIAKIDINLKLKNLLNVIKKENVDVAYDGNCPYHSEIVSIKTLRKYSQKNNLKNYPYKFFYFYNEFQIKFKSIGVNHRKYNFNGTFILPGGGKTIGDGGDVNFRLNFIPDLTNKTFLDIGSEEGYSVFNAISKNAKFAKGINIKEDLEYDYFPDYHRPTNITSRSRQNIDETISFLKKCYNLEDSKKIIFEYENIYNIRKDKFDYVFCFGVLYHLKNPYLAIENLFKITNEILIIETQGFYAKENKFSVLLDETDGFVRHSPEALRFLLLKAGFKKVEILFSGVNKVKKISNIVLKALKS